LIDVPVSAWFHAHAHTHPAITQIMLVISRVHTPVGICLLALILAGLLLRWHRPWSVLALALCVPGGLLLNATIKQIFQRARPHFEDSVLTLTSFSFPSGHAAGATVFYGFLAVLLLEHERRKGARAAIVAAAAGMVALVGLSRIYLGVHYLSDVLGGVVEGVIWLALCLTGVRALSRRRTTGG
jgi:membrane-associated phospholipid phosphatase